MKRHCDLCDHQKLSLKEGSLCGLTNKKPNFNKTCVKINFNSSLLNRLEDTFIEYEDLKLTKNKVYKNLIYGSIIGIFLLMFGYFVFNFFLNNEYRISNNTFDYMSYKSTLNLITMPSIILISGYYFIKSPVLKLRNYKKELTKTEKNISEIESVLNLYNQKYKYKVNFDKEIHGIQEVEIDIELT